MLPQTEGKIFLANERKQFEMKGIRRYHTFNVDGYSSHQIPFGGLSLLNDETLAGGCSLTKCVDDHFDVIILPTIGTVHYSDSTDNETFVEANQVQSIPLQKDTTFEISNPYEGGVINYIQIWIKRGTAPPFSKPHIDSFDLVHVPNRLVQITPYTRSKNSHAAKLFIGKFAGRNEFTHTVLNPESGAFVFVLQGAFEVQYRLLEARDGLALWNTPTVEVEALSNEAILLVIEVPLD